MRLEATERWNLGLSAGAVAASFAFASPHFATSLALGAALEAVNVRGLHASARALFAGAVGSGGPWVGAYSLRFVVLALGIVFGMQAGAHPLGLVLGLSIAMPATLIGALWNRPPVLPAEPEAALPPDDPSWDQYSIWQCRELPPQEEDEA